MSTGGPSGEAPPRRAAPPASTGPLRVFISYSHNDKPLQERLETHLRQLELDGILDIWHDPDLIASDRWDQVIMEKLAAAEIILLLVSADFIASDYCRREMNEALARAERDEARVVPVLLHPCNWQRSPFASLQVVPRGSQPISTHPRGQTSALSEVAEEVGRLADELQKVRRANSVGQSADPQAPGGVAAPIGLLGPFRTRPWWQRHRRQLRWGLSAGAMAVAVGGAATAMVAQGSALQGLRYLRLGDYQRAAKAFQKAARANPFHPLARCGARAAAIGADRLPNIATDSPELQQDIKALPRQGPCGAQRELFLGDLALERHRREGKHKDWDAAQVSFERAVALDDRLAEAEERLGVLADAWNDLPNAERHFRQAVRLAENEPALGYAYRNGLAKLLLQGDGLQRGEAMRLLDGDRGNPGSDLEAAMQLWRQPASTGSLGQALERLPAQPPPSLQGSGAGQKWGFKLANGKLVLVGRRGDQRCLLAQARAATLHLDGQTAAG